MTTQDSIPASHLRQLSEVLSYPLVRRFMSSGYPILSGLPTTYIIDRKGIVRYIKLGAFEPKEFVDMILPLLREPAPAP